MMDMINGFRSSGRGPDLRIRPRGLYILWPPAWIMAKEMQKIFRDLYHSWDNPPPGWHRWETDRGVGWSSIAWYKEHGMELS